MNHRNVTTTLKFHVETIGEEEKTGMRQHLLLIDSYSQSTPDEQVLQNPGDWDLSKPFVFENGPNGTVEKIFSHPKDRKELVIIKKGLTSLFSVYLERDEKQDQWDYSVEENDHLGKLQHNYSVSRTDKGFRVQRHHFSVEDVHRFHNKTLHYDHRNTLQSAAAYDRIVLKDKTKGVSRSNPFPGEEPHVTSTSGPMPDFEGSSYVTVTYTNKRQILKRGKDAVQKIISSLQNDSLETKFEKPETTMDKVQQNITQAWNCIHKFSNKEHENRSVCVNQLRDHLRDLNRQEYREYAEKELSTVCDVKDAECEDDRLILIDIVSRMGDVTSQELVVKYVLSKRPWVDEELRRVFIHCTALEHPVEGFVSAVEKVCFGEKDVFHGSRTLSSTQSRACLAVGSLVKHLDADGQLQHANRLSEKLETWLDRHGEGDAHIVKREATEQHHGWMSEDEETEHLSKAVLLHSLGNGALPRSRSRLLQHAEPNSGHHIWRRAAVDALRHFNCSESARAVLNSAMQDEVFSVRRIALGTFANHRRRRDITREEEDKILSKNYTYKTVARVKRSFLDNVLFQFKVALPSFEWSREVGNSGIGASFGVKFQNSVEGMFRILEGYVDVDVHDKLWAEAHVGMINVQVDLLLVEACYKGRLSYNMNIVKDYTVGLIEDINGAFDHVIQKIMEPVEKFTKNMAADCQNLTSGVPKSSFQPLSTAVETMTFQTQAAVTATKELQIQADQMGNLPLFKKLQSLSSTAQAIMEDVHSEAVEIFANIVDVAKIALPLADKEIRVSINSVLGVIGKVTNFPQQSFVVIERAKLRFQLALTRIFESSAIIKQTFSTLSGGKSSWNNAKVEIISIVNQIKLLMGRIKADYLRRTGQPTSLSTCEVDLTWPITIDVKGSLPGKNTYEYNLLVLFNKTRDMVMHLELTMQSAGDLQRALDLMNLQVEVFKAAFSSFKEAIDIVKARIHTLFGVKFHPSFPNQRRDCDGECACGHYPTDCRRYGHPGVDLVWADGWKVPSPLTGTAYKDGNNAVRITPQTTDLKEYVIIVSNIILHANYSNKNEFFLEAGQIFAYSKGSNGCNKGHIHVAMKRTSNTTAGLCHYVDPSPFLNNFQPVPKWHQECKEFTYKHIGQVIDFKNLTGGFKFSFKELKRLMLNWIKDLSFGDIKFLLPKLSWKGFDLNLPDFKIGDIFNLFGGGSGNWTFFDNINFKMPNLKGLLDFGNLKLRFPDLSKLSLKGFDLLKFPWDFGSLGKLNLGTLSRFWEKLTMNFPHLKLPGLPDFKLPNFGLPSLNVSFDLCSPSILSTGFIGSQDKLLANLKSSLPKLVCPALGKLLSKQGSPCIPTDDCKGLTCDVTIHWNYLTAKLNIGAKFDPDTRTLTIILDKGAHVLIGDVDKTITTNVTVFDVFNVYIKLNSLWRNGSLTLTLKIEACGINLCCLPEIVLAATLPLPSDLNICDLGSLQNNTKVDFSVLPLHLLLKIFADMNFNTSELLRAILEVKEAMFDSLDIDLPENLDFSVEFNNPAEQQDVGKFPLPGQQMEQYFPFFGPIEFRFMLGPVPMVVGFRGGGVVGLSFDVEVKAVDSLMKITFTPFATAQLDANCGVDIFIFSFGIELQGHIMQTKFPLSIATNYTKQPVITMKQLDIYVIPIELRLSVYVEIKLQIKIWGVRITIFHKKWTWPIWKWTSPGFGGTIWKKIARKDDNGPPRFLLCDQASQLCNSSGRKKRSVMSDICLVKQLPGRYYKDVAFQLEFNNGDEDSDLAVAYTVGDYPGGTNLRDWTVIQGSVLVVPESSNSAQPLPCGRTLYFTVRAVNSQGLTSFARCSLPTLDCTLPDGRVDPEYKCTSLHDKLLATVVVYEDSKLDDSKLVYAVGFGPGSHGNQVSDWQPLTLEGTTSKNNSKDSLQYFAWGRPGRLLATPIQITNRASSVACADECLKVRTCFAFSFDTFRKSCELHSVTEGTSAKRLEDNDFYTYEKLGYGYSAKIVQELPLQHGVRYYINSQVTNVLGYHSALASTGVLVDHTPPEPGPLGVGAVEKITRANCNASIIQRCQNPADNLVHRHIIDGKGARTVFNGNRRGQDVLYTFENHYVSANWDGFFDAECNIFGFTWAVGTTVCGTNISEFKNPHVTLRDRKDWTYMGLTKNLHLPEGLYYCTVQAISDIFHGGDHVTTVCHSTPFVVDITPPVIHSVSDIIFDDGFSFLAVYFSASDNLSGIGGLEFGLGLTKYDVMVRPYLPTMIHGTEDNMYLLKENFETAAGVPSWIRLKIIDNVNLFAVGHGPVPVLLDSTAPVAGEVLDGMQVKKDARYQSVTTPVCAQWQLFEDPESHIESYWWGAGTKSGKDDVAPFRKLSSFDRHACESGVSLQHNTTYYSTVVAYNKALNQKKVNISSNGVLVDTTPPVPGQVVDGDNISQDIDFTSETASVTCVWSDFMDPESGIESYSLSVLVNGDIRLSITGVTQQIFIDHSFNLLHGDEIRVEVQASNNAGSSISVITDGLRVDHTPPDLLRLSTFEDKPFQQDPTKLEFVWQYQDLESGVAEYRWVIYQHFHRSKTQFLPQPSSTDHAQHIIALNETLASVPQFLQLQNLSLVSGAKYILQVTAMNLARMTAVQESRGITIDSSPPVIEQIYLSLPDDQEEVNIAGEVEHVKGEPLYISWKANDFESSITKVKMCISLSGTDCLSTNSTLVLDGSTFSTVLIDKGLQTSLDDVSKVLYQVSLVVVNGAGAQSLVALSKPILVLEGNVAGIVLDGRYGEDEDFTNDKASLAITFAGFSSPACGIESYHWGVGSSPYATDVLPYSDTGLVINPKDHASGTAQANIELIEGKTYYGTVRASTGHNCHEPYILSSSNGITVDTMPPVIAFFTGLVSASLDDRKSTIITSKEVIMQTVSEKLDLGWEVSDRSGMNKTMLSTNLWTADQKTGSVNKLSLSTLVLDTPLFAGQSVYSAIQAVDGAGNEMLTFTPSVTFDENPPVFQNFTCTKVISVISSLVTCTWQSISEEQSGLEELVLGVGSGPAAADLMNITSIPLYKQSWSSHMSSVLALSNYSDPTVQNQAFVLSHFFILVGVKNTAGLTNVITSKVQIDFSPPEVSRVIVVTSPAGPAVSQKRVICQSSNDFLELAIQGLHDNESEIQSVEVALGSSPGTSDLQPFLQYTFMDGLYVRGGISIQTGTVVFATARVTNSVGLYRIVNAEAVFISPDPVLKVMDGPGTRDADGQANLNTIQGQWTLNDLCPIISGEWWVTELGSGRLVRSSTPLLHNPADNTFMQRFYDDSLTLQNMRTYLVHVRVTDAQNRTFEAFSDGVTVCLDSPETAAVWEGKGHHDMDFQVSLNSIQFSWDSFGDPRSTLPSEHILWYEVAIGTDRLSERTRTNIHGFENVGLVNTYMMHGLNLIAKTVTYYITVRAYSDAGTFSESSSDGIRAGYSGEISPGRIMIDQHQSATDEVRVAWEDFVSDMGDMRFYVGISSTPPNWDNTTKDCEVILNDPFQFDLSPLGTIPSGVRMVSVKNLSLLHNNSYYVTIIAEDLMLHCIPVTGGPVLVDITPPDFGHVIVEGYNTDTAIFLHSSDTVIVDLSTFHDAESGIESVTVGLYQSSSTKCGTPSSDDLEVATIVTKEQQRITLRNLALLKSEIYYLSVAVRNRARLETRAFSKPLMLSISAPTKGMVKLSTNWTNSERLFSEMTDAMEGLIGVSSMTSNPTCTTEVNSLAVEWKVVAGNFSKDCSFIKLNEITLLVQHNPYLTGVDRGAVQLSNITLAEGNYTVRLKAAAGENMITGIGITSPTLLPPFRYQNSILSDKECDNTTISCRNINGPNDRKLLPDGEYGFGVSLFNINSSMETLFWAADRIAVKQTWLKLDFDPTLAFADYVFTLKQLAEGAWEVALSVNGVLQATVSGLVFPEEVIITLYTWNLNDYFPPVTDPLTPFKARAEVVTVKTPLSPRLPCSYGVPFHDGTSGLKEVWVGVSSAYNQTADVAPFTLAYSFCPPCFHGCQRFCPASCQYELLVSDFQLLKVSLGNLSLQAANDVILSTVPPTVNENKSSINESAGFVKLPMYYLDVMVVSHGGLKAWAKSSALTVDTSPPSVKYVYSFDPVHGGDNQPAKYIGSNTTVGLRWEASDDVCAIFLQRVSLGTQPGIDDIVSWTSVDHLATKHTFKDIFPPLSEKNTYYLSVEVTNAASLVSISNVTFTVLTSPPDMSVLSTVLENVNFYLLNVTDVSIGITNSTDTVSISFNFKDLVTGNNTLQMIAWSVGTAKGKGDLFPKSIVANPNVTRVALIGGYVYMEGSNSSINIKDYVHSNFQSSNSSDPQNTLFSLEPGRCVSQTITGISLANVESVPVSVGPFCIQREGDIIAYSGNATYNISSEGTGSMEMSNIQISLTLTRGAVIIGALGNNDLNAQYGTAASSDFSPFIVHPDKDDPTSRILVNRILELPGPNFFLSPLGDVEGYVEITYDIPASVSVPANYKAMLVFWNPDSHEWMTPEELCPSFIQFYNNITRQIHSQICLDVFLTFTSEKHARVEASGKTGNSVRRKRSVTPSSYNPRMLTLSVVGILPVNSPPIINNPTLVLQEDDVNASITVPYNDAEGDILTFSMISHPRYGRASVTVSGTVTYSPQEDYAGDDIIILRGIEILDPSLLAAGLQPYEVSVTITVIVTPLNDPPQMFYLPGKTDSKLIETIQVVGMAAGNGINYAHMIEGNATTSLSLGIIIIGDADTSDSLTYFNQAVNYIDARLEVSDVPRNDPRLSHLNLAKYKSGFEAKAVSLNLTDSFFGMVQYNVRLQDTVGAYSKQLTLTAYIMISPCVHGGCQSNTGLSCVDPTRAQTFDPYSCVCEAGYEGNWCERETDECMTAACSPITDCVDLINGYRCDPNPEKTAAIIICSILAVVLIIVGVYKLRWKLSTTKDVGNLQVKDDSDDAMEMSGTTTDDAVHVHTQDSNFLQDQSNTVEVSRAPELHWYTHSATVPRPHTARTVSGFSLDLPSSQSPEPCDSIDESLFSSHAIDEEPIQSPLHSLIMKLFPFRPTPNPTIPKKLKANEVACPLPSRPKKLSKNKPSSQSTARVPKRQRQSKKVVPVDGSEEQSRPTSAGNRSVDEWFRIDNSSPVSQLVFVNPLMDHTNPDDNSTTQEQLNYTQDSSHMRDMIISKHDGQDHNMMVDIMPEDAVMVSGEVGVQGNNARRASLVSHMSCQEGASKQLTSVE